MTEPLSDSQAVSQLSNAPRGKFSLYLGFRTTTRPDAACIPAIRIGPSVHGPPWSLRGLIGRLTTGGVT